MEGILVAKVDGINVIQVEESKIAFEHKRVESKKPSKKGDNPLAPNSGGSNKSVDLGAGQRKLSIKIYTLNNNDSVQLFNILWKKRYCTIIDKFNGKLNVYIDSVEKTDSDKHLGRTVFAIQATVQEIDKQPTINASGKLRSVQQEVEDQIEIEAYQFAEQVKTVDRVVDEVTGKESFFDSGMAKLESGLNGIISLSTFPSGYFQGIQDKVNRAKRLLDTLKRIEELPNDFVQSMLGFIDILTIKNVESISTTASNGKTYTRQSDFSDLSQTEREAIQSEISADSLLNTIILGGEIKQVLEKQYSNEDDFNLQVQSALARLDATSIDKEKIAEYKNILRAYSNSVKLKRVVDYEVKKETPLVAVVFELYGNLDYYDDIRKLNNLSDNDAVIGTIKVYDASSS